MSAKYRRISLPDEMINRIQELNEDPKVKEKYAFKSIAEFIRWAVSEKIKEVEREITYPPRD